MPAEPVIVLGAGAIGSVYAVKMAERHPVTVVGRGAHVDAIRSEGLRLIGRETVTARLDAVTRVEAIAPRTQPSREQGAPSAAVDDDVGRDRRVSVIGRDSDAPCAGFAIDAAKTR